MRPKTSDVRMRKLPTPLTDTVRSYVTTDGKFVVSKTSDVRMSGPGRWQLLHQPSQGVMLLHSYRDCIDNIRRLRSAPATEQERWVIMSTLERYGMSTGQVVFDRASGRWWRRGEPITERELRLMSEVQPIAAFQLDFADIMPPAALAESPARQARRNAAARAGRRGASLGDATEAGLDAAAHARRR